MDQLPNDLKQPLVQLLLAVADDKLMLGHRNADWTGLAPILEEDIAFSSMAQDELAHATALYQMIAELLGTKSDALAYGRKPEEYRCAQIVELSDNFDWAVALARSLFCDHFDAFRLDRLSRSTYTPLAQLGKRLVAEEQIHVQHADSWLIRLGHGNAEARARMQQAIEQLALQANMLFEPTEGQNRLEECDVYPGTNGSVWQSWLTALSAAARSAGLDLRLPAPSSDAIGGRRGRHSEGFASLLDEMTEVYRLEPDAAW